MRPIISTGVTNVCSTGQLLEHRDDVMGETLLQGATVVISVWRRYEHCQYRLITTDVKISSL